MKLKPGMTANVSIIAARKDNVLQIKNAALRYRPAGAPVAEMGSLSPSSRGGRGTGLSAVASVKTGGRDRTSSERTVYVLPGNQPKAVQIKTGISDGVVTAEMAVKSQPASTPANPFSGTQRRFP